MVMKPRFLITVVCILLVVGPLFAYLVKNEIPFKEVTLPGTPVVRIDHVVMRVEIAQTDPDRAKGLSDRKVFDTAEGLLFVFPESDFHGMWMKDMHFPIDIIWIDEQFKIVAIEKNVDPQSYPKTFKPPVPVKYAIETNIHYADTVNLHVGQSVELPKEFIDEFKK